MQHRVTFLDFGICIDAQDRPADQDGAVLLGHANKIPGHGWHVRVADRTHTAPGLTKKQAKALLKEWAEQALTPGAESPETTGPTSP